MISHTPCITNHKELSTQLNIRRVQDNGLAVAYVFEGTIRCTSCHRLFRFDPSTMDAPHYGHVFRIRIEPGMTEPEIGKLG